MKKTACCLLMVYFLCQLAVPAFFVYRHYSILRTGESYKFEVSPHDPYDPFRGRYVALQTSIPLSRADGEYALLEKDADGYAVITEWVSRKPAGEQYVKNLQLDRYYMNEKMAPRTERLLQNLDLHQERLYLLVKVKNGGYVIQGLYINDVPIEQHLAQI